MDEYREYAGGLDVQVTRVDEKVTLSFYQNGRLLMQADTSRAGAMAIVQKIIGAMQ